MKKKEVLQWHPAFYAEMQIELEAEKEHFTFENEHQLGTKPKEIDVLIIKKDPEYQVKKNIGQIFLKHNIIEYKSPTDYLGIDDFYQVYGYACFYKADTDKTNNIDIRDITITFVCSAYPRKLMQHLKKVRNYQIVQREQGIYSISGDNIPMQLIVNEELSENKNLYLRSLTDKLPNEDLPRKLIYSYKEHKDNRLYESVMDIIVRANIVKFGGKNMCNAIEELMKDKLDAREQLGLEQGLSQGLEYGELLKLITLIQKKYRNGKDLSLIASELEEKSEDIESIYRLVEKEPEKSAREILDLYKV